MFNLRYHIASLVAVFLALTVGLVLGSVIVERGLVDRQKNAIVRSLQEDFGTLNAENRELRADATRLRRLAELSAPSLVKDALRGKRVAVVVNGGRVEGLSAVRGAIELAGGEAHVMTIMRPDLGIDTPAVRDALARTVGSYENTGTAVSTVVRALAEEWVRATGSRSVTDGLRDAGVLRMEALTPSSRIDAVVVVSAWDGVPDAAAIELAVRLQALGLPAVGVEVDEATGVAAASADAGLSAIDHVEEPESVLLLVRLLAGTAKGHYGMGPGADQGFPPLE